MLIAFDGTDGVGKSSQLRLLIEYLTEKKIDYYFFDMGGFELTKKYLYDLKHHKYECSPELRELLYYFEGHLFSNHYETLNEKTIAICDRWLLTYFAYGQFNGINYAELKRFLSGLVKPDLYFYLDLSPEIALERIKKYRKFDSPEIGLRNKMSENEDENNKNFLNTQNVIRSYYKTAINNIDCTITKINANQDIDIIQKYIRDEVIKKYEEIINGGE